MTYCIKNIHPKTIIVLGCYYVIVITNYFFSAVISAILQMTSVALIILSTGTYS